MLVHRVGTLRANLHRDKPAQALELTTNMMAAWEYFVVNLLSRLSV